MGFILGLIIGFLTGVTVMCIFQTGKEEWFNWENTQIRK